MTPIFMGLLSGPAAWTAVNARKSATLSDLRLRKALPAVTAWLMALLCTLIFHSVYYSVQPSGSTAAEDVEGLSSPENIALLDTFGRIVALTRTGDSKVAFILGAFVFLAVFFTFAGYYNLTWSAQIASSTRVGNSWPRRLGRLHNSRGAHDIIVMLLLFGVFVWLVQDDPIHIVRDVSERWTRWLEEILT